MRKKVGNNRFGITPVDFVFIAIFLCLSVLATYFCADYNKTEGLFNIEKTNVNFIISAPSKNQVEEIKSLDSVDEITPYIFKSVDCTLNSQNIRSNLFIIEDNEDLNNTVFSDQLLISSASSQYTNPLYISNDLAKNAGLSTGDTIELSVRNKQIKFSVQSIYKSDYRLVGGTMIAVMQDDILEAYNDNNYKYNGAYICSNDTRATSEYLETYIPLGDLRDRDEFDNDEQYEIYLKDREQTDYTKTTLYCDDFIRELHNRNDAKSSRELLFFIASFSIAVLAVFLWLVFKSFVDIKNNFIKDIYNSFSNEQEKGMYYRYFANNMLIYSLVFALAIVLGAIWFGIDILSVINALGLIITIAMVAAAWLISIAKLNLTMRNYGGRGAE